MAGWNHRPLYRADDVAIVKSVAHSKGDTFSPPTMPTSSGGVHWLTKGSIVGLNAEGLSRHEISRGDFVGSTDPQDYADEQLVLIAQEAIEFFCITDPDLEVEWTGEVHDVAAGETLELTGLQGKRIFIAEDGLEVNGSLKSKHVVLSIETTDNATIVNTGEASASFAVFYRAL